MASDRTPSRCTPLPEPRGAVLGRRAPLRQQCRVQLDDDPAIALRGEAVRHPAEHVGFESFHVDLDQIDHADVALVQQQIDVEWCETAKVVPPSPALAPRGSETPRLSAPSA